MLIKTRFKELFLIKNKKFKDKRGYFKEILKEKDIRKKFPFFVMSFSKKNVIRGIHIQNVNPQGKYISILKGEVFDVALDLRKGSRTFGKYFSSVLSEKNLKSIYIPPTAIKSYRDITTTIPNLFLGSVAPTAPPSIRFSDFSSSSHACRELTNIHPG